jgi:hypothetical protein
MCKKEIDKLDIQIKVFGKEVSSKKSDSEKFLQEIGILTKQGKISKNYQQLCTQPDQA